MVCCLYKYVWQFYKTDTTTYYFKQRMIYVLTTVLTTTSCKKTTPRCYNHIFLMVLKTIIYDQMLPIFPVRQKRIIRKHGNTLNCIFQHFVFHIMLKTNTQKLIQVDFLNTYLKCFK